MRKLIVTFTTLVAMTVPAMAASVDEVIDRLPSLNAAIRSHTAHIITAAEEFGKCHDEAGYFNKEAQDACLLKFKIQMEKVK